jgi:hypothetical protein
VGRHDDEHLRRFVAARDAGDADAMRRWWEELVISIFDRMDGIVGVTHRGRLNEDEHEAAVSLALANFSANLIDTFNGVSMGQLVNATKRLAFYACVDIQRRSVREGSRVSLDDGWDAGTEDRAPAAWEADEARGRFAQDAHDTDMALFLEWALPQLNDNQRRVVELTFYGAEVPEICERLAITPANAYQLRSRGLKELAKLLRQYEEAS